MARRLPRRALAFAGLAAVVTLVRWPPAAVPPRIAATLVALVGLAAAGLVVPRLPEHRAFGAAVGLVGLAHGAFVDLATPRTAGLFGGGFLILFGALTLASELGALEYAPLFGEARSRGDDDAVSGGSGGEGE
jgi:hypothetical protein